MRIRAMEQSDIPRIKEIYAAQGFEYNVPDFSKMHGQVLEDDAGIVRMVLADRPTVEMYMLLDREPWAAPGMKFQLFERLHEAERKSLEERGITDAHAWVPKCARSFAHKLRKIFGWVSSSGPDGSWEGLTRSV